LHSPHSPHPPLSSNLSPEWQELIDSIFNGLVEAGTIDIPTTLIAAKKYTEAISSGYGKSFDKIEYNSPDYNAMAHLERNVYQFSAAKNYQTLRQLTSLIYEGNRQRSYQEFRREAVQLLDTWNDTYMRTEYDLAVASSQMASKWQGFKEAALGGDKVLLQYSTVGDRRVREAHAALDGVIKDMNDPFWATYYPPNGYNCRCSVVERLDSTHAQTPDKDIVHPNVHKLFRINLAEKQLAFPPDHPYYTGCPKHILAEALALLPYERRFEVLERFKNGGELLIHADYKPKEDHDILMAVAREKAKAGRVVHIMPMIHQNDVAMRKLMMGAAKGNANPDLMIDGVLFELKNPTSKKTKTIAKRITQACQQCDNTIINTVKKFDERQLKHWYDNAKKDHPTLEILEFRYDGDYWVFPK
jgi:SPP1 gp7 family putative phage head morphogenesis protein